MCTCGGTGQNQTHKDVYTYFLDQRKTIEVFDHREETGTGIFLVPDPEAGIMEEKAIRIRDLTYKETVKRGKNCISFAFVPNKMKPFEQMSPLDCSGSCPCNPDCLCGGFGCI